jgi:hypothetical protein
VPAPSVKLPQAAKADTGACGGLRAHPSDRLLISLIPYPGAAGSAGFRLAIQNTSGLRGARIKGRAIDVQQALRQRGGLSNAEDLMLRLDADDPLDAMVRMTTEAG